MVKKLFLNEGLLVGPSSGAVMFVTLQFLAQKEKGLGVMIFADDGNKYKSVYSEIKLFDNGKILSDVRQSGL